MTARDPRTEWDWRVTPEDHTTEADGAREKDAYDDGANDRLAALRPLLDRAEADADRLAVELRHLGLETEGMRLHDEAVAQR